MIHSEATAVASSARWSCGHSSDPLHGRGQGGYTPRRPSDTVSDAVRAGDIRAHGAETPFGDLNRATSAVRTRREPETQTFKGR